MNTITAIDGRRHIVRPRIGPGRPSDVTQPLEFIRGIIQREIKRLEREMDSLCREQNRWVELFNGLNADLDR